MQGLWDDKGGWVSRIKQDIYSSHLKEAEPWKDYNIVYMRANSSETSEGLKNRFLPELEAARDSSDHSWTMVFSIGMNDCAIDQNGNTEVSRADYHENIRQIIDDSKNVVDQVIVVGLNPVDESVVGPGHREEYYRNGVVEGFDKILREACEEKDVKFIPLFDELKKSNWDVKLFDGLHANTEGHKMIYEIVRDPILEEIELDLQ